MYKNKKLGIIGGMGSRAGAFFLQKIIDYSPADTDQEFLEIIFHNNSAIPDRTRAIVYNERSPLNDILKSIRLFNDNGIDAIALSCITSYYYYDQITQHTKAIVLHPLKLLTEHIRREYPAARRIGVLATTGSVNTGLFHKELQRCNVDVVTLLPESQEDVFMRAVYMKNGFKSARISEEARHLMNESFNRLIELDVDLIIGGCTEVSLGINPDHVSFPYIDLLDLLAKKTVDHCYTSDFILQKSYING